MPPSPNVSDPGPESNESSELAPAVQTLQKTRVGSGIRRKSIPNVGQSRHRFQPEPRALYQTPALNSLIDESQRKVIERPHPVEDKIEKLKF